MSEAALARIGRFVADACLAPDARTTSIARDGVIDTLGCIYAGASTDVARRAREGIRMMGGEGRTPVMGTDFSTTRPHAALLNAVAGHALDFDDWEIPGNSHPSVVLVPTLVAVSPSTTSGQAFIAAYLVGYEVIARLGEAINFEHYDAGWHTTATLGALGAAAAASRLLGLPAEQATNALSVAVSLATGYTCQFGSSVKPLQAGFSARAGVEAALFASAGLTGQPDAFDARRGMAKLMGGLDRGRLEAALSRLGRPLALAEHGLVLKPWPGCGYTHRLMTCAVGLCGEFDPGQVARINLALPDFHAAVLPFGQPANRSEALFSLPFVTAMGLLSGNLTLADLVAECWRDPLVVNLISRTRVQPFAPRRPDLNYSGTDPDRLRVVLTDGRVLEQTCVYPIGSPQTPMSARALWAKFRCNSNVRAPEYEAALGAWPEADNVLPLFTTQGISG